MSGLTTCPCNGSVTPAANRARAVMCHACAPWTGTSTTVHQRVAPVSGLRPRVRPPHSQKNWVRTSRAVLIFLQVRERSHGSYVPTYYSTNLPQHLVDDVCCRRPHVQRAARASSAPGAGRQARLVVQKSCNDASHYSRSRRSCRDRRASSLAASRRRPTCGARWRLRSQPKERRVAPRLEDAARKAVVRAIAASGF